MRSDESGAASDDYTHVAPVLLANISREIRAQGPKHPSGRIRLFPSSPGNPILYPVN